MFVLVAILSLCNSGEVNATIADYCEVNHCYTDDGKLKFVQQILWDKDGHVIGFRIVNDNSFPYWTFGNGFKMIIDGKRVVFRFAITTWTKNDPEEDDRAFVAPWMRRGILKKTKRPF